MAFVDETDLASVAPGKGADMVGFAQPGTGAAARTVRDKLRENVSITDFGGVPDVHADSTPALDAAIAALGPDGGVIDIPMGDWWMNAVINQDNIKLRGQGGVGELSSTPVSPRRPCIRPYAVGPGTATLRISNRTRLNRRIKLENIVINGDDGDGGLAERTLWIDGGTLNFATRDVDLQDGMHTLHIEPGGGFPAAGLILADLCIRNDIDDPDARAIYVRRHDDPNNYATDVHIAAKVNRGAGSDGYWLEVNGTGSPGLVVHFHKTYVDHVADKGILMHGSEAIECFGGLQLDPGAPGTVIVKRLDMAADPSRYLRGFVEGVGGQKVELNDASTITLSDEPGLVAYQPRLQRPFLGDVGYFTTLADPYGTSIHYDFQTASGPMRWNGCAHRWTDASDAVDGSGATGAVQTAGGISAAKSIHSGAFLHSVDGLKVNGLQVLAARQGAVAAPAGVTAAEDVEARNAINAIIARLQKHGLIG